MSCLFFFYPNVSAIYWMELWCCWPVGNSCGMDLLSRATCLFHTCSPSHRTCRKWVKDQYYPNVITSQKTQAKAPLMIDLMALFHFPRYFLKCWTQFSLLLLLLRLKVLFLKKFPSFPPYSFNNVLSIFPCVPVFSVLCELYSSARQGCGGSVGRETQQPP